MPNTHPTRPPLREAQLRRDLVVPGGVWRELRVVAETGSTNADVAAAARSGAEAGLVVVAEEQRAGRGRMGRHWQAPARSSVLVSVLLRPGVPAPMLGWLPLLAGLALVESVGRVAMVDTALKWPNDLLARPSARAGDYGKCAGVLSEVVDGGEYVVLGIGLNVDQLPGELPPAGPEPAPPAPTSLVLAGAACTDRDALLLDLLATFARWYERWRRADADPDVCGLRRAYQAACVTLHRRVSVALPGGEVVSGEASAVDAEGRLVLAGDGGVRPLAAGDVAHLR